MQEFHRSYKNLKKLLFNKLELQLLEVFSVAEASALRVCRKDKHKMLNCFAISVESKIKASSQSYKSSVMFEH